jgi:S-adenosylmethionine hydrolase
LTIIQDLWLNSDNFMKPTLTVITSFLVCLVACVSHPSRIPSEEHPLVLTTDFGLKDGAVSAMKGVAYGVDPRLVISDLSHEIEPYNIWEVAYRLEQTYKYWPAGTVFVTVVDPGVGSQRKSVAVRTKTGHYFVGPDNGHLTLVADGADVDQVRAIDENQQRLKGSAESHTFHGRDLYVYVGARLAAGQVRLEELGPPLTGELIRLPYQPATVKDGALIGNIPVLDPNYGNVWTNISKAMVKSQYERTQVFRVRIFNGEKKIFDQRLPLSETFSGVARGKPLLYFNSLLNLSAAVNQGDFAKRYKIRSGPDWHLHLSPD